ncbi:MAG: hypothetical protein AVDCRST_MAG07-218, partial [uncultured Frankineae bacterium]
ERSLPGPDRSRGHHELPAPRAPAARRGRHRRRGADPGAAAARRSRDVLRLARHRAPPGLGPPRPGARPSRARRLHLLGPLRRRLARRTAGGARRRRGAGRARRRRRPRLGRLARARPGRCPPRPGAAHRRRQRTVPVRAPAGAAHPVLRPARGARAAVPPGREAGGGDHARPRLALLHAARRGPPGRVRRRLHHPRGGRRHARLLPGGRPAPGRGPGHPRSARRDAPGLGGAGPGPVGCARPGAADLHRRVGRARPRRRLRHGDPARRGPLRARGGARRRGLGPARLPGRRDDSGAARRRRAAAAAREALPAARPAAGRGSGRGGPRVSRHGRPGPCL